MKLELAIIENLQREDLNPIDRAKAFRRLVDEFGLKHADIGKRVGKSREYVSNSLRILALPQEMQDSLQAGNITEGHTRPLLMLMDRPEEQRTLFKEIVERRLTVRDTEQLARRVAIERVRKIEQLTPDLVHLERQLTEKLGTRVRIEKKDKGGKVTIDFFSPEDLAHLCLVLAAKEREQLGAATSSAAMDDVPPTPVASGTPEQPGDQSDELYSVKNFTV
jgi:ParB family chromosome partitioning protein